MPKRKAGTKRKLSAREDKPAKVRKETVTPAQVETPRTQSKRPRDEAGKARGRAAMPVADSKISGAAAKLVTTVTREFQAAGNPAAAAPMKSCMRNQFDFFGIKAPERKAIARKVFKAMPGKPSLCEMHETLLLLWQQREREFQYFGSDYADRYLAVLKTGPSVQMDASLACLKELVTTKSWWDTVDCLASIVGAVVAQDRTRLSLVMDQWSADENMWLRRVAILHQLKFKASTDQAQLFRYCLARAHESEFFIRKAIGWSLRQYSKQNPAAVRKFIKANKSKLSKLSISEGSKYV